MISENMMTFNKQFYISYEKSTVLHLEHDPILFVSNYCKVETQSTFWLIWYVTPSIGGGRASPPLNQWWLQCALNRSLQLWET